MPDVIVDAFIEGKMNKILRHFGLRAHLEEDLNSIVVRDDTGRKTRLSLTPLFLVEDEEATLKNMCRLAIEQRTGVNLKLALAFHEVMREDNRR